MLTWTDLLETTGQQQFMVQFDGPGQQLRCDLRASAAGREDPRALFDRLPPHEVRVRAVWLVEPDDVHDRQAAPTKRGRQLGHRRNRVACALD